MSDPVTNVEIEDVLSSIRKLVAEESRATPPAAKPKPERPGRLVLTPAQRVAVEDPAPEPPASDPILLTQPVSKPTEPVGERTIDEIPGDARLADFGNVEGAFPDLDDFEDTSSETDLAEPHKQPEDEDTASRGNLNRLIEQEVASALGLGDATEDMPNKEVSEAAAAEDEWHEDDWDDADWDVPEEPEFTRSFSDAIKEYDTSEHDAPLNEDAAFADVPTQPVVEDRAPEFHHDPEPTPPLTLEDKVAALGRLVAREPNEFEEERDRPDADELSAVSEPMAWPDPAPFEEVQEDEIDTTSNVLHAQDIWPQSQTPEPVAEETASADESPLPVVPAEQAHPVQIDEDMLREIVVDTVRQELQGALGERITRNVRKLVRREIHRMLISQDFD